MWIQIAIIVVSMLISYATRKKTSAPSPGEFGDDQFPQDKEGTPQCVIFGDCWCEDWMVIGTGNFRTEAIKKSGGKK